MRLINCDVLKGGEKMLKKIFLFFIMLTVMSGVALAATHPSPAVTSSIIKGSTATGGNYYYLFTPDQSVPQIKVIRAWTDKVGGITAKDVTTIPISGGKIYGMTVNSDVTKLYVSIADSGPNIAVYDINYSSPDSPTFTLKTNIAGVTFPMGLALSRDNKYLYVADASAGKVHIIETATNTIKGSINVGGTNLTGVAVNPDNSVLAVSRNLTSGSVYIYDISAVPTTIPTSALYTVTSGMDEPTYLQYSSDGLILYVKVNQKSGDFNDLIGLNPHSSGDFLSGTYQSPYSIGASLSLVKANEEHPNNKWDGFALSPNDSYIYISQYRNSIDPTKTTDDGVYIYVINTAKLGIGMKYTDTGGTGKDDNDLGWQFAGPIVNNEGYDSVISAPNGGRVWAASSVYGNVVSDDSGTGYYKGGVLNTPPGGVSGLQVENPLTAPKLKWNAAVDDDKPVQSVSPPQLTYIIEYKTALIASWQTDLGNTKSLEKDLSSLASGSTYYFRVKAYDGENTTKWDDGWFGPYVTIGPVVIGAGGQTPSVSYISPNAAPNTADVTTTITGKNFENATTVTLKKTGETDISGTVTYNSSTSLSVLLPIKSKTIGKWDVVVTNTGGKSDTVTSGFTILDSNGGISQIIDDFEGIAVDPTTGYSAFTGGGTITFAPTTADKQEGSKSMSVSYPASNSYYRGYSASLKTVQDISSFTNIVIYVKSADTSASLIKVQLADANKKTFAAVDSKGDLISKLGTKNASWTKYTIPISSFVEIDSASKPVAGGATLDIKNITDYHLVFTGAAASTSTIYVDFIAAEKAGGVVAKDIVTSIVRKADSAGSPVTVSWQFSKIAPTIVDIYTISGTSGADVFTTTTSKWQKEATKTSTQLTYEDNKTEAQVGKGYQKYYKVLPSTSTLSSSDLAIDVVGKFDVPLTGGYNLISTPFMPITTDTDINKAIGAQMTKSAAVPVGVDKIYKFKGGTLGYEQAWLYKGATNLWYDATTMKASTMTIVSDASYWVELADTKATQSLTLVGEVSSLSRSISVAKGFNFVGHTYPISVKVGSANLTAAGGASVGASPLASLRLYTYENAKFPQAYLTSTGWKDITTEKIAELKPGMGYILEEPSTSKGFTWTYTRPY